MKFHLHMGRIRQDCHNRDCVDGGYLDHGVHGGGLVDGGGGGYSLQAVNSNGGQAQGGDVDRHALHG